jgi:hypothetical protein
MVFAVVFWFVRVFVAPSLFFAMPFRVEGPIAFLVFVFVAPLLVAVPGGLAYGLIVREGPMVDRFAIAFAAASLVALFALWAGALSVGPWWAVPLEGLLFDGLFVGTTFAVSRLTARLRTDAP